MRYALVAALSWAIATSASAYNLTGGKWDMAQYAAGVPYCPVANSADATTTTKRNQFAQALDDAMAAWTATGGSTTPAITCSAYKARKATCTGSPSFNDSQPWVYWEAAWSALGGGSSTIGVTLYYLSGSEIVEAKTVFNDQNFYWSVDGSATDVGTIAVHEFGHFVGLGHYDEVEGRWIDARAYECYNDPGPYPSVMCAASTGNAPQRIPTQDDRNAVCFLYPNGNPIDPPPANSSCTCDTSTACDGGCEHCDPECRCDCDRTTTCDRGCEHCDPECDGGCLSATLVPHPGSTQADWSLLLLAGVSVAWLRRARA